MQPKNIVEGNSNSYIAHCSYLDIYISQKIGLCVVKFAFQINYEFCALTEKPFHVLYHSSDFPAAFQIRSSFLSFPVLLTINHGNTTGITVVYQTLLIYLCVPKTAVVD